MPTHKIVFWVSSGFVAGAFIGALSFRLLNIAFYAVFLALAILQVKNKKNGNRRIFLWFLIALGTFSGLIYFNVRNAFQSKDLFGYRDIYGSVSDLPIRRLNRQIFTMKMGDNREISVDASAYEKIYYRDKIKASGFLERDDKGGVIMKDTKVIRVSGNYGPDLMSYFYLVRQKLLNNIGKSLYGDGEELAKGIILGDQSGFSKEFKDAMKRSGTTHLVALSGFNITIVSGFVLLFFKLFFSRKTAFVAAVIAILVFVLIAGIGPSLLRAMIMAYVAILGKATGRIYNALHALVVAAALMTLHNPWIVLNDLGFELSFIATFGMIVVAPFVINRFNIKDGLKRVVAESLVAQVVTFPIIALRIGFISWLAFIPNVLISYLMPLSMASGAIIAIFGRSLGPISWIISFVAQLIFNYEVKIINLFSFNF